MIMMMAFSFVTIDFHAHYSTFLCSFVHSHCNIISEPQVVDFKFIDHYTQLIKCSC